jgi:hypothetical protein
MVAGSGAEQYGGRQHRAEPLCDYAEKPGPAGQTQLVWGRHSCHANISNAAKSRWIPLPEEQRRFSRRARVIELEHVSRQL